MPVHVNIHITSDVDNDLNPTRGVTITVVSTEQISKEDVVQLLKSHGFEESKVFDGLTRTSYSFVCHPGGKHYEIYIGENIQPKPEIKKTQQAPAEEVEE